LASVLELFCGTGNISFGLREAIDRLVGLEVAEQAVQTANTMADFKQLDGYEFRRRDLASGTGDAIEAADGPFDGVILDPPRGGAKGVVEELNSNAWMGRDAMIYVSCDPPALARDLEELTEGPWVIEDLAAFDMFPMTSHLEMGAVLRRE
jgi:23S rRNA (uracil1939-C5)-methyltransferase